MNNIRGLCKKGVFKIPKTLNLDYREYTVKNYLGGTFN